MRTIYFLAPRIDLAQRRHTSTIRCNDCPHLLYPLGPLGGSNTTILQRENLSSILTEVLMNIVFRQVILQASVAEMELYTRMVRLMEVVLHSARQVSAWPTAHIHQLIIRTYNLKHYTLTQLRYDLRKLKAHGLLERQGRRYLYRLTDKGLKVAVMFVLFHKRLCGPLAQSLFNRKPDPTLSVNSKLETAYRKADHSIQKIVDLLAA